MPQFRGSDAELSEQERFGKVSSEAFRQELQKRRGSQDYSNDNIRDCWPTLITAIVLGGISLVFIVMGIAKFSDALKMTTQSMRVDVPESIKRDSLSYIR